MADSRRTLASLSKAMHASSFLPDICRISLSPPPFAFPSSVRKVADEIRGRKKKMAEVGVASRQEPGRPAAVGVVVGGWLGGATMAQPQL